MRTHVLLLSLFALFLSSSCFSPAPSFRARSFRARSFGPRMMANKLDPMQLVQDKAMQTCALRPYRSKEVNNGLSTATFALG